MMDGRGSRTSSGVGPPIAAWGIGRLRTVCELLPVIGALAVAHLATMLPAAACPLSFAPARFERLPETDNSDPAPVPENRILLPTAGFRTFRALYHQLNPPSATPEETARGRAKLDGECSEELVPAVSEGSPREWLDYRGALTTIAPPVYLSLWSAPDWGIAIENSPAHGGQLLNCRPGAFHRAVAQLKRLRSRFDDSAPELVGWVEAQDAVFSKCNGDPQQAALLPEPLAAAQPDDLRMEREYQRASWLLYAGEHQRAAETFLAAAHAPDPERAAEARYSAARAYLRHAELSARGIESEQAAYAKGEQQLLLLVAHPEGPLFGESCRYLHYVRNRNGVRAAQLAPLVAADRSDDGALFEEWSWAIAGAVRWTPQNDGRGENMRRKLSQPGVLRPPARTADLNDWMLSIKSTLPDEARHAVERWRATGARHWLIAALQHSSGTEPESEALLSAASSVPVETPGGVTIAFHRARLLLIRSSSEEGRAVLDELLRTIDLQQDPFTANVVRALRFRAARSLAELIGSSFRRGYDEPSDRIDEMLAADSASVWTEAMPLTAFIEAASTPDLPEPYRRELAIACWTRAYLLGRGEQLDRCGALLSRSFPETADALDEIGSERNPGRRSFLEALFLVRFPGLRPYIRAGAPREVSLGSIHSFGDNWWCPLSPAAEANMLDSTGGLWSEKRDYYLMSSQSYEGLPRIGAPYPPRRDAVRWLSDEERGQAAAEWEVIRTTSEPHSHVAAALIDWVDAHPEEAHGAEALHRVARRATRFGCGESYEIIDSMRATAERAYRLLRKRYPRSAWTKKTPGFG